MDRKRLLIGSVFVVLLGVWVATNMGGNESIAGMHESWSSLTDAMAQSGTVRKAVLVDVYTDWCGWCKKMDKDVYTDETVKQLLDRHFIAVKLDAESSDPVTVNGSTLSPAEFARQAGVTGYPTTLFLDETGKPITAIPGYVDAKRFASILQYVGEGHYRTMSYDAFRNRPS